MSLDPATVRRIARLARIRLDDAQVAQMGAELNSILGWIEQLNEVNVDGVTPMAGGTHNMAQRLRADAVTDGGIAEQVLANAPDREGAFYTVPKVVE
ncbi:MAG TPA: Asp-tRNA(Asn)/Glu-tRNA(Gln) amidotransferase subunit GatC [Acetobacteraceae bacterium]|jgi:aspartyl-tRNA(Asn)/glutamyl-tRNA(Gln) amidotransferase subunit C|nr:Asp-tRNA(Asn)/Glu-tRNA(Gln) amidotransferase subunit GatC [Acetobacteraceae bacterium]